MRRTHFRPGSAACHGGSDWASEEHNQVHAKQNLKKMEVMTTQNTGQHLATSSCLGQEKALLGPRVYYTALAGRPQVHTSLSNSILWPKQWKSQKILALLQKWHNTGMAHPGMQKELRRSTPFSKPGLVSDKSCQPDLGSLIVPPWKGGEIQSISNEPSNEATYLERRNGNR